MLKKICLIFKAIFSAWRAAECSTTISKYSLLQYRVTQDNTYNLCGSIWCIWLWLECTWKISESKIGSILNSEDAWNYTLTSWCFMVVQKIRQLVHLQVITELETVEICKEYYQYSRKCTNTSDTKHTIVFIDRIWQIIVRLKVNLIWEYIERV